MITSRRVPVSWARRHNEPAIGFAGECGENSLNIACIARGSGDYRYSQRLGCRFSCAEEREIGGYFRHVEDCDPTHTRRDLFEHLQPFAAECWLEIVEAGHVPARMGQACDVAAADGIGYPGEDNGDEAGRLHRG